MWSGVRKSGWPMPRLMMSRPWAASALARASTAKAFSSPIRSNAAMVFSIRTPYQFYCLDQCALVQRPPSTGGFFAAHDLNVHHLVDLKDDGHRNADQKQTVE